MISKFKKCHIEIIKEDSYESLPAAPAAEEKVENVTAALVDETVDIQAIVAAAVAEAIKPLQQEIKTLKEEIKTLKNTSADEYNALVVEAQVAKSLRNHRAAVRKDMEDLLKDTHERIDSVRDDHRRLSKEVSLYGKSLYSDQEMRRSENKRFQSMLDTVIAEREEIIQKLTENLGIAYNIPVKHPNKPQKKEYKSDNKVLSFPDFGGRGA